MLNGKLVCMFELFYLFNGTYDQSFDLCIELYSFNVCASVMLNFMQEFVLLLLCSFNGYSAQNGNKSALIKVSVSVQMESIFFLPTALLL